MTEWPGASYSLLCILGKKYNFPRFADFLKLYKKYLHSFGEIHFFTRSFLNILLLSSTSLTSSLSPNLTSLYVFESLRCFSTSNRKSFLSQTTTQKPLSAGFSTILQFSTSPLIASHSSFARLYLVVLPGKSENTSASIWLKNISNAECGCGGFQVDLLRKAGVWLKFSVLSFLKCHLHLIFLEKSEKSLLRSASLISDVVGEKPNPLPSTCISKSEST